MSTLGAQTALYSEDRGFQVPMSLEDGNVVGTQCSDILSEWTTMIFQVSIKTHSSKARIETVVTDSSTTPPPLTLSTMKIGTRHRSSIHINKKDTFPSGTTRVVLKEMKNCRYGEV
jgi:hypothetical protein